MNASRFSVITVISINSIECRVLSLTPHHDIFSQHHSQPPALSPTQSVLCEEQRSMLRTGAFSSSSNGRHAVGSRWVGGSRQLASSAYTPIPSSVTSFCSSPTGSRFWQSHFTGAAPGDRGAKGQKLLDMFLKQPKEIIVSVGPMSWVRAISPVLCCGLGPEAKD